MTSILADVTCSWQQRCANRVDKSNIQRVTMVRPRTSSAPQRLQRQSPSHATWRGDPRSNACGRLTERRSDATYPRQLHESPGDCSWTRHRL